MKRSRKNLIILSIGVFSLVFALFFKWIQTGNPLSSQTLFYGVLVFLNIIIPLSIAGIVLKKYSHKSLRELKKKIIPAIIIVAIVILAIQIIMISAGVYLYFIIEGIDTSSFFSHLLKVEIPGAIKQYAVWMLMGTAGFFYFIWRRSETAEQELRETNLKYRYRTLKSQVNPHFLFNSLNTLSEMVYSDPEEADRYIQELAGIYRYVIENEEKETVPLQDEIKFTESFFRLYEKREKDKISLDIRVGDVADYAIIPVSLQSLIENALKHNTASRDKKLGIEITKENNYLVVSNNIQKKNIMESMNMGLENLKERVKLITGKDCKVTDDGKRFIVRLPIIPITHEGIDN